MMALVESHLRSAGHEPRFAMRANTNTTAQALVGAGVGPAILPRLAVNEDDPRIAVVELGELLPARRVALYWHQGRRNVPALTAFQTATAAAAREVRRDYRRRDAARAEAAGVALGEGASGPRCPRRLVGTGPRRRELFCPADRREQDSLSARAHVRTPVGHAPPPRNTARPPSQRSRR